MIHIKNSYLLILCTTLFLLIDVCSIGIWHHQTIYLLLTSLCYSMAGAGISPITWFILFLFNIEIFLLSGNFSTGIILALPIWLIGRLLVTYIDMPDLHSYTLLTCGAFIAQHLMTGHIIYSLSYYTFFTICANISIGYLLYKKVLKVA